MVQHPQRDPIVETAGVPLEDPPRRRLGIGEAMRQVAGPYAVPGTDAGGGLDSPLRSLPQDRIARAKPALEYAVPSVCGVFGHVRRGWGRRAERDRSRA